MLLQGLGQPAGLGHFTAEQSDQRRQLGHGQPSQLPVDRDLVKDFKTDSEVEAMGGAEVLTCADF